MTEPLTLEDRAEKLAKFLDFHIGEPVGNQVRELAAAVRADERAKVLAEAEAMLADVPSVDMARLVVPVLRVRALTEPTP